MRHYKIKVGNYYLLSLPVKGGIRVEGKVLGKAPAPTESSNRRWNCEVTSGPLRGKEITLTSRRVLPLEEVTSEEGSKSDRTTVPSGESLQEQRPDYMGKVMLANAERAAERAQAGGKLNITMTLTIPVADLPTLMVLLEDYKPEVVGARTTRQGGYAQVRREPQP